MSTTIRGRSQNSSFVENRLASLGEHAPGNQDDILAGAIEDEIHQLIRFQIETFRQPTPLSPSQLLRSSFPCGKNQGAWQGARSDLHQAGCGAIEEGLFV